MSNSSRERVLKVYADAELVPTVGNFGILSHKAMEVLGVGNSEAAAWDDAASRLSSPAGETPSEDDPYACSFTASGEHAPSAMGDCIYCSSKDRPHKMRESVPEPVPTGGDYWTCLCGCKTFDEVCPRCSAPVPSAPEAAAAGECKHQRSYSYSEVGEAGNVMKSGTRKCVDCGTEFSPPKVAAPIAPAAVSEGEYVAGLGAAAKLICAYCMHRNDAVCTNGLWIHPETAQREDGTTFDVSPTCAAQCIRDAIKVAAPIAEGDGWIAVEKGKDGYSMTNQPKPAPTAEEQLPPLQPILYWIDSLDHMRKQKEQRENQLLAALRSNRDLEDVISAKRQHLAEKDAKIAELEQRVNYPPDFDLEITRTALLAAWRDAEAKLRAVLDEVEKRYDMPHFVARIRSILDSK